MQWLYAVVLCDGLMVFAFVLLCKFLSGIYWGIYFSGFLGFSERVNAFLYRKELSDTLGHGLRSWSVGVLVIR